MAFEWKKLLSLKGKGQKPRKRLVCTKCDNAMLWVIWEPVARQARTMNARHMRVVAKCPSCKDVKRVSLGSPT